MNTHERLQRLADALLPGQSVTFTLSDIQTLIQGLGEPATRTEVAGLADLTVEQVGQQFGRSPSTVRGWLSQGLLTGAYRLQNREWRIPVATVRAFLDRQREGKQEPQSGARAPTDLGAWRQVRGKAR